MGQIRQIKQAMGVLKNANNPQALLLQMAQNNPQMAQVLEVVKKYNNNPMEALTDIAKKNGYDPQAIIELLR